jgi:hypothetical protein
MDKVFDYVIPALGISLILAVIGGYVYLTAVPDPNKENLIVLADQKYLDDNQQKYADCYYTTKSNPEFITSTVVNQFYNQGAPKARLIALEPQFLAKYTEQCTPIMSGYESRFKLYDNDQINLAKARQTEFEKIMKKTPVVEKQQSDVISLYEKYDPKTLQYPTYDKGRMLYTADEFADYLNKNL